jgi:hypothetical protein
MRKLLVIIICVLASTYAGLVTRPSYILIGQLNWIDVLTKGYYVGSIPKVFTQSMLDESFYWLLKFQISGFLLALISIVLLGGKTKTSKSKKK